MHGSPQVLAEFTQLVPETNKFHEQLLKIFKKKIKRQKKKAVAEGEEEEEGSGSEEDSEEDMSDLDEEEEEEEEDFCPPGCEPSLFEQVCELREKRLDQEEMLAEFQKAGLPPPRRPHAPLPFPLLPYLLHGTAVYLRAACMCI